MALPAFIWRDSNNVSFGGNTTTRIEWPRDEDGSFTELRDGWVAVLVVIALVGRTFKAPDGWQPTGRADVVSGGCPKWQHHFMRRDFVEWTEIEVGAHDGASAVIGIIEPRAAD